MSRRERLSALDASFLYIESESAPSHGAFLSFLDGPVDFHQFKDSLARRVMSLKRYRQVIRFAPFNLAHPSWEFSPAFDLEDHVHHVQLDPPASEQRAHDLTLDIVHRGLDKSKPMWSIYVVNGIEGDRAAIINLMHHCMVDGAADAIVTETLFDRDPIEDSLREDGRDAVPPMPGKIKLLIDALLDDAAGAAALLKRSPVSILRTVRALRSTAFRDGYAARREYRRAPALRFPFNVPLSGKVRFSRGSFPLVAMRSLGTHYGATINDVLISAVTGGVQEYARECGLDTAGKFFKIEMPTNVRLPKEQGEMGNFAVPVPVHVPLDLEDPVERLRAVIECTSRVKRLKLAFGISYAIQTILTLLSPPGLKFVENLYGATWLRRLEVATVAVPGTNMFITNIPRPEVPLYVAGRKILTRHVLVPLLPNQGMVCGALTYDRELQVTFTGDAAIEPGVDAMMRYTLAAFERLIQESPSCQVM